MLLLSFSCFIYELGLLETFFNVRFIYTRQSDFKTGGMPKIFNRFIVFDIYPPKPQWNLWARTVSFKTLQLWRLYSLSAVHFPPFGTTTFNLHLLLIEARSCESYYRGSHYIVSCNMASLKGDSFMLMSDKCLCLVSYYMGSYFNLKPLIFHSVIWHQSVVNSFGIC